MLRWGLFFVVMALLAALFGYTSLVVQVAFVSRMLFAVFVSLAVVFFAVLLVSRWIAPYPRI